jgi:hypothetical protein
LSFIEIKCSKRKNNATIKGKQRDNVNKAKAPSTFSIAVEISSPRKPYGWSKKSAGGGDCE